MVELQLGDQSIDLFWSQKISEVLCYGIGTPPDHPNHNFLMQGTCLIDSFQPLCMSMIDVGHKVDINFRKIDALERVNELFSDLPGVFHYKSDFVNRANRQINLLVQPECMPRVIEGKGDLRVLLVFIQISEGRFRLIFYEKGFQIPNLIHLIIHHPCVEISFTDEIKLPSVYCEIILHQPKIRPHSIHL